MEPRGYHGIGIVGTKNGLNVGTLWRSAAILGANFMFTAGRRYPDQASDTVKAWRHVPLYEYESGDALINHLPKGCVPVAIEITDKACTLESFTHPERACYILGAEDTGVPPHIVERCKHVVQLPGDFCLNVAVAGSIVLYDRLLKRGEQPHG